jgi:transcription antitermination protein NusB
MGQRRQSRELALQVLFQQEFAPSLDFRDGLELFKNNFDAEPDTFAYAIELLKGVSEKKKEIDALIQSQSAHWSLSRMSLVDVILMRIAVYELKFGDGSVPPPVVLNEAIEISKKYSTSDSAAFVNGILDQIMK